MTGFLIRLFVKDSENLNDGRVRRSVGTLSGIVGIICNLVLCTVKIAVGLIAKSISVVADGLNNLSDMGSSVITMLGFRLSGKPADRDHPFGHGRLEYMATFAVSGLILVVGFELLISSLRSLISGDPPPLFSLPSIIVLTVSIAVKLFLFFFNRKAGRLISSDGLIATAQDSVNDAAASLAILCSVVITKLFSVSFNLDAVMAILVALYIIWSGVSSAKTTISDLLGRAPDRELVEEIRDTVMSFSDFLGIHDLIVHDYGPGRMFASIHVEVPQTVDIVECHERIDLCEKVVFERTGVELVIHMDPIDTDNETVSQTKEKITGIIKSLDSRLSLHDFRMTPVSTERTNLIFDLVLPSDYSGSASELREKIEQKAKCVNPTFALVITFDRDLTGQT